ncbi:MAG: histidine ammonia-lyase [Phycisphaerales bacterium JB038]
MNETKSTPLPLSGAPLTIAEVVAVARGRRAVELTEAARQSLRAARAVVEETIDAGRVIYGLNTGFGSLSRQRVEPAGIRDLQRNLIRSHCAGVGEPLPEEIVRAMMLILAASLSRGHSGVRVELVELIVGALNRGVTPQVPERGSVGASGDLAPLAHIAAALMGEGEAAYEGVVGTGAEALQRAGLRPLPLDAKEGLALINGTHLMTALAALTISDLGNVFDAALAASALSLDACLATDAFLDPRLHEVRNQPGQREVARRLRRLIEGSEIVRSHRDDDPRVQDPYSLRCTPQVLGAALDALGHSTAVVEQELGGVTDNPLVFPVEPADWVEGRIISGGNFHGMPLALALDLLGIATAYIAGISERRLYFLLAASDEQNPINPYLSPQPGLHSGLMIAQYTAAACCNEIQTLSTPASVANIPTSAGMGDYNSFGPNAGFQARRAVDLALHVVAIELLCSSEALEYHRPRRSGVGVERTFEAVRRVVPRLSEDRPISGDISRICALISQGEFVTLE